MSVVHVRHIKGHVESLFADKIDISDVINEADKPVALISRSLSAYAVTLLSECSIEDAAKSIVDGYHDNGIDAVYFNETEKRLYLVQSKYNQNGSGSPPQGDVLKFIEGCRHIINDDLSVFKDPRFEAKKQDLNRALYDTQVKIVLVLVWTGINPVSDQAKRGINTFLREINDTSEIAEIKYLSQKELHKHIKQEAAGQPVSFDLNIKNWGYVSEPIESYYGQVSAADLRAVHAEYGQRLFSGNIRSFIGLNHSEVNDGILQTVRSSPEMFWYYNNGITLLCSKIQKKNKSPERSSAPLSLIGARIVNGAQTVGTISSIPKEDVDKLDKAFVSIRVIEVAEDNEHLPLSITKANNIQNRIERRDFAALDPEQHRLKSELFLEKQKEYVYRTGESLISLQNGCTIDESAIALACSSSDVSLAVQAKREVGKLYENIEKAPYKIIFNSSTSASLMWISVLVMRRIDHELRSMQSGKSEREAMILTHGNRFILHRVFSRLKSDKVNLLDVDIDDVEFRSKIQSYIDQEYRALVSIIARDHPSAYLNSLFKNASKCKSISSELSRVKHAKN